MKDRKNCCPECDSKLLARVINKIKDNIICLSCSWEIKSKREEDKGLPKLSQLKQEWQ